MPKQKTVVHIALFINLMGITAGIVWALPRFVELYSNQPWPASPEAAQVYRLQVVQIQKCNATEKFCKPQ